MSFCAAVTAEIHSNFTDPAVDTDPANDTNSINGTDSTGGMDSAGDTTATTATDGRLATGAIAGIAVGIVGAVAIAIAGLAWWFLRGKRKTAASKAAALEKSVQRGPPPEITGFYGTHFEAIPFNGTRFDGTQRPELPNDSAHKFELPVSGSPAFFELPGHRY